ncbi:unnamed protein product [Eretmochelys imbricata]
MGLYHSISPTTGKPKKLTHLIFLHTTVKSFQIQGAPVGSHSTVAAAMKSTHTCIPRCWEQVSLPEDILRGLSVMKIKDEVVFKGEVEDGSMDKSCQEQIVA